MENLSSLIGDSAELLNVLTAARIVALTDTTVLIQGESGTGKELLARYLHQHSRRANTAFVTISCTTVPTQLPEADLFGYRKGSFPGADNDQQGKICKAHGGTLLLDEISELPLSAQAKLLRFLETGECQTFGDSQPRHANVRVIATTNKNLYQLSKEGKFRADLFFRLNIVPLEMPALRHRSGDIHLLAQYFLTQYSHEYQLNCPRLSPVALQNLMKYPWPGNVREIRNLCERLVILKPDHTISQENLPAEYRSGREHHAEFPFNFPDSGIKLFEWEKQIISTALRKTQGNRSKAARLLGLSRDTLLYRIKKYALH